MNNDDGPYQVVGTDAGNGAKGSYGFFPTAEEAFQVYRRVARVCSGVRHVSVLKNGERIADQSGRGAFAAPVSVAEPSRVQDWTGAAVNDYRAVVPPSVSMWCKAWLRRLWPDIATLAAIVAWAALWWIVSVKV